MDDNIDDTNLGRPDTVGGNAGKKKCCNVFDGNRDAIGVALVFSGTALLAASNFYFSASLIWLAKDASGCFDNETQ